MTIAFLFLGASAALGIWYVALVLERIAKALEKKQ
jgi:hypothetical protein